MKTQIGIAEKNTQAVANILNTLLADEHILYVKTRNYHWNYIGDNFMEMHKFYEAQYDELAELIDEIAERVRMIGHFATGSLKEFSKMARLDEPPFEFSNTTQQDEQLQNLLNDHETIIRQIRKDIEAVSETYKDAGTADFLTGGLLRKHEKMAWMIRSYLK
jgi:starvation-inducible DNA-binding protein